MPIQTKTLLNTARRTNFNDVSPWVDVPANLVAFTIRMVSTEFTDPALSYALTVDESYDGGVTAAPCCGGTDPRGRKAPPGVAGQAGLVKFIKLPPVEKTRTPDIVKFEARQQIPFALEEVIWDYQQIGDDAGEDAGAGTGRSVGEVARQRDVLLAGGGVARGMVVDDDDRRGVEIESAAGG